MVKKIARSYVCICVCMVHLGKLGRNKKNNNKYVRVFLFSVFSYFLCRFSADICVYVFAYLCRRKSNIVEPMLLFSHNTEEGKKIKTHILCLKKTFRNIPFTQMKRKKNTKKYEEK